MTKALAETIHTALQAPQTFASGAFFTLRPLRLRSSCTQHFLANSDHELAITAALNLCGYGRPPTVPGPALAGLRTLKGLGAQREERNRVSFDRFWPDNPTNIRGELP